MNTEKRQLFWDALCAAKGNNIEEDSHKIQATIEYPRFLYRYRAVSVSSIDALQTNHLHFSRANYYDDPFDTLLKIDFPRINARVREMLSAENLNDQFARFCTALGLGHGATQDAVSAIQTAGTDNIITYIDTYLKREIQPILKNDIWSICFSESGVNETMWLKYADQYRGFCLMYDLTDDTKRLCGKQEKCENCVINHSAISLYPMYYSDVGYEATEYAANLAIATIARKILNPQFADMIISTLPQKTWEPERISLIKAQCHEYDLEWRMILCDRANPPVMQEWIPYGLILGLRMSDRDKAIVMRNAKSAGIQHIFSSYITDDNKLNAIEIS